MNPTARCFVCREPLPPDARYCGACGRPTRAHRAAVAGRHGSDRRSTLRAALALGLAASVVLFGLLAEALWLDDDAAAWWSEWFGLSVSLVAAAAAGAMLGWRRDLLPLRARAAWWLAAVPVAAVTFGAAVAYVAGAALLLQGMGGADQPPDADAVENATLAVWVGTVVFAPLGEELLCRGTAFRAAERLGGPRSAVLLTAILFAFLHGLNGAWLFELPHRFVCGLAFGWLRLRSGSVGPAIVAHALHNTASMLIDG